VIGRGRVRKEATNKASAGVMLEEDHWGIERLTEKELYDRWGGGGRSKKLNAHCDGKDQRRGKGRECAPDESTYQDRGSEKWSRIEKDPLSRENGWEQEPSNTFKIKTITLEVRTYLGSLGHQKEKQWTVD